MFCILQEVEEVTGATSSSICKSCGVVVKMLVLTRLHEVYNRLLVLTLEEVDQICSGPTSLSLQLRSSLNVDSLPNLPSPGHFAPVRVLRTSIWDETLYRAWSCVVQSLIPNVHLLNKHLQHLADMTSADEVVLFEKSTFVVISSYTSKEMRDVHR